MSSKSALIGMLVLTSLSSSSCSLRWGESPAVEKEIEFVGGQERCLKGSVDLWKRYFSGVANPRELSEFWSCTERSVSLFLEKTRGESPGRYTSHELRGFLIKYFFDEEEVSSDLVFEFMRMKQALIGGTSDAVTRSEIETIRSFVRILQEESHHLLGVFPLTRASVVRISAAELQERLALVQSASKRIGSFLDGSFSSYSFKNLDRLLGYLSELFGSEGLAYLRSRLPLLVSMKTLIISHSSEELSPQDWRVLFRVFPGWYSNWLQFAQLMEMRKNEEERLRDRDSDLQEEQAKIPVASWVYGEGRALLTEIVERAYPLLKEAIRRHPEEVIEFRHFDDFIDAMDIKDLPGEDPLSWKRFLRPLFRRLLSGGVDGPTGRRAMGLTAPTLERLWDTYTRWKLNQQILEATFQHYNRRYTYGQGTDLKTVAVRPQMLSRSLEDLIRTNHPSIAPLNALSGEEKESARKWLMGLISNTPPLFEPGENIIQFNGPNGKQRLPFWSLSISNILREVNRLLIEGYAASDERRENLAGVTYDEFHCFTDDVREVGIALKWIDSRKYDMHYKRFMEANLFTHASNGDDLYGLYEGTQTLAFLFSTKAMAHKFHVQIGERCDFDGVDPWGYRRIRAQCFRDEFFQFIFPYMDYMPRMKSHFRSLDGRHQERFRSALETAARAWGVSERPVESADSLGFALVLHYVEALFARFDGGDLGNASGYLERDEARKAFPVFQRTLSEVVRTMISEDDLELRTRMQEPDSLESLFMYLLKKGNPPDPDRMLGKLGYWWWLKSDSLRGIKADRTRLVEIFAALARQTHNAAKQVREGSRDSVLRSRCWMPRDAELDAYLQ